MMLPQIMDGCQVDIWGTRDTEPNCKGRPSWRGCVFPLIAGFTCRYSVLRYGWQLEGPQVRDDQIPTQLDFPYCPPTYLLGYIDSPIPLHFPSLCPHVADGWMGGIGDCEEVGGNTQLQGPWEKVSGPEAPGKPGNGSTGPVPTVSEPVGAWISGKNR